MCSGTQTPIQLPSGLTPEQFMQQANEFGQAANGILPYSPVPGVGQTNSNEFNAGLLLQEGITPPPAPGWAPGYNTPLVLPTPITTPHGAM
jgi:hypothetical protein